MQNRPYSTGTAYGGGTWDPNVPVSSMTISGGQAANILGTGTPASVFPQVSVDQSRPYVTPKAPPQPGDPKSMPLSVAVTLDKLPWNTKPTPRVENTYEPRETVDLSRPYVTPKAPPQPGDPKSIPLSQLAGMEQTPFNQQAQPRVENTYEPRETVDLSKPYVTPAPPPQPGDPRSASLAEINMQRMVDAIGQATQTVANQLRGTPWEPMDFTKQDYSNYMGTLNTKPISAMVAALLPPPGWEGNAFRPGPSYSQFPNPFPYPIESIEEEDEDEGGILYGDIPPVEGFPWSG